MIRDISPTRNVLAFDLIDVLRTVGEEAEQAIWKIAALECLGDAADRLHAVSDNADTINGKDLFRLATQIYQTIDGDFSGYRNSEDEHPWIIVRAVDSTSFVVECDDSVVLDRLRQRFKSVTELDS